MPTNTYVELDTRTLSVNTSSVTLNMGSSISQAYRDLEIVINGGFVSNNDEICIRFNGDTGSTYSTTFLFGDGGSALATRQSNATSINCGRIGSTALRGYSKISINNYSNTVMNKTALCQTGGTIGPGGGTGGYRYSNMGMWRSTSAITSITFFEAGGNSWLAGTTFSIYGIGSAGGDTTPKALGGEVFSDSTHYYHLFKGAGTFEPLQSLSADILVVAGGGGSMGAGGGGGAGGLLGFASQSLTAQRYPVLVGAGGAQGASVPGNGTPTNGNDSKFGSLTTALGGAYGAGFTGAAYVNAGTGGGSGGGGAFNSIGQFSSGTAGQGNSGNNGYQAGGGGDPRSGGGGGGAGGAATNGGVPNTGGTGGIGATNGSTVGGSAGPFTFINAMGAATGTGQLSSGNYYYAGGGGGEGKNVRGAAGLGGGGIGGTSEPAQYPDSGVANTGGGAGSGPNAFSSYGGAKGGSGIVIVRYAKV